MNFRVDRWRAVALRSSLVILTTVGALLLSSCGGGGQSSQSKRFKPTRMIVFGDESSLLVPPSTPLGVDAYKYSVNFVSGATVDCRANLLWVQQLAAEYGLVFAECNPAGAPATAQMRATAGGKVADVALAVDAFLASSTPVPTDLITMMAGTNDIIELYNGVIASPLSRDAAAASAVTEIKARALVFASQINRLVNYKNTKGRVLYSTVPEVNLTPFGQSKSSADQALLKQLTESFNDGFRVAEKDGGVITNGRSLGFIKTQQRLRDIFDTVNDGNDFAGLTNVTHAACTVPASSCTQNTLVSVDADQKYLWADELRYGLVAHRYVGELAVDLATSLPF